LPPALGYYKTNPQKMPPTREPELNSKSNVQSVIRPLHALALGLGLWVALVILFATQFVLVGSFTWPEAFVHAFFFWGAWALLMPAVFAFSLGLPFERGRIPVYFTVHLLACILVVTAGQLAVRYNVVPMPPPPPEELRNQPAAQLRKQMPATFLSLRAGLDIMVYWAVVGVCQSLSNFRRSQQRERQAAELEARLAHAKLQALRMQINPHFLFNTLNAISTLLYVKPKAADEMIGDLSELLRRCLDGMDEQEAPLSRELQFIDAYINIEQKRFGERLRMEQNIPHELLNALIPVLILQPLVENAIRHGIEPQRSPGLISIQAQREGDDLRLTVRDNGRGPVNGTTTSPHHGIGLPNTQARLQELYGPHQHFSFGPAEPRGCLVEIRLPYHTEPAHFPAAQSKPTE
jgi:signal transduction histidine kinase